MSYQDAENKNKCQYFFNYAASRCLDTLLDAAITKASKLHCSLQQQKQSLVATKSKEDFETAIANFRPVIVEISMQTRITHANKLSKLVPYSYIQEITTQENNITAGNQKTNKLRRRKRKKTKKSRKRPSKNKKSTIIGDKYKPIDEKMFLNRSMKVLTTGHQEILTLGDSFIPTPGAPNLTEYHQDIENFINSLRWAYYFHTKNENDIIENNDHKTIELKILPKTNPKPAPTSSNHCLELFIQKLREELTDKKNFRKSSDNITKIQRAALNDLMNDTDIVIRRYDKGKGYVIDNAVNYVERMEGKLILPTFINITGNPNIVSNIHQKIKVWSTNYSEHVSTKISKNLISETDRPGYNYGNYKAHKPDDDYPLRLITSGCGSPVQILSSYVEYFLQPLVLESNNVVIDTSQFLCKVEEVNRKYNGTLDDVLLVTWDIENMFPSINNEMGIAACKQALDARAVPNPPTDCIIDALKIVLENNISYFNHHIYQQVEGTAMGPNHACSYADLSLAPIDQKVDAYIQSGKSLLVWVRYRDDIFGLWKGSEKELQEFTQWLNTLMPGIKFKLELCSKTHVHYLDCTIYKHNQALVTTLYQKLSDTHAYLVPTSCHPPHIAKNIAYGVAVRCRRICTLDSDYDITSNIMIRNLIERGYDENFVKSEFARAKLLDRNSLLHKSLIEERSLTSSGNNSTNKFSDRCFPLVTTFNPTLPDASRILKSLKPILALDTKLATFCNPNKIFVSFRKNKSLGDILINSRFPKHQKSSRVGSFKCSGCSVCNNYLVETDHFTSYHTDKTYKCTQEITCTDEYIIYLINDKLCQINSVGRSENNLRSRWPSHKSHIKTNADTCKVAKHFNNRKAGHAWDSTSIDNTLPNEIAVTLIDKVIPEVWDTADSLFTKLCKKEIYWQNQLRTMEEFGGLNTRDERRIRQKRTSKK